MIKSWVKALITPITLNEAWCRDQIKLGPNTTDKLVAFILFSFAYCVTWTTANNGRHNSKVQSERRIRKHIPQEIQTLNSEKISSDYRLLFRLILQLNGVKIYIRIAPVLQKIGSKWFGRNHLKYYADEIKQHQHFGDTSIDAKSRCQSMGTQCVIGLSILNRYYIRKRKHGRRNNDGKRIHKWTNTSRIQKLSQTDDFPKKSYSPR